MTHQRKGYIDNHIKPNIGNIPLEKLTTMDLQKFYRKLLTKGRVERVESKEQPKGLSAKTVWNINQVISSAMDLAVAQKIIPINPTNACELPKVEHKEMQTIQAEQLQAFLEEARVSGVYEMYYIELATGLRRGELLGLKWQDIDWKNGIIKVRRQVARVDGLIVEAPLKTKNSYRAVTISQQAIEVLKNQKAKTHEMVKIGTLFKYQWGSLASESSEDGEYDFVTASTEWKTHTNYSHDCEALVYAVSAAGSLGRAHYVNGKFIASNLCIILTPKSDKYRIDMQFYKFYFNSIKEQIRADLADGTSKLTISPDDLMEYYIEYVPYDKQVEFYKSNIVPYEQLVSQLKLAEDNLQKGIVALSSGN